MSQFKAMAARVIEKGLGSAAEDTLPKEPGLMVLGFKKTPNELRLVDFEPFELEHGDGKGALARGTNQVEAS